MIGEKIGRGRRTDRLVLHIVHCRTLILAKFGRSLRSVSTARISTTIFLFFAATCTATAASRPLKGVSESGAEFGTQLPSKAAHTYTWPTAASIQHFAARGMGVIRIPFLWERLQPKLNGALQRLPGYIGSGRTRGHIRQHECSTRPTYLRSLLPRDASQEQLSI